MLTHLCYAHLSPICLEARCTFNCVWLDAVHEDFEWTEKGLASQHVGIVILQWWPNHVRSWDHSLGMMWDDRDVWRLLKPHCLSRQEALPMGTGCKHAFPPGQWTSLKSPDYVQWCITTISHHARMLSQNEYMQYCNLEIMKGRTSKQKRDRQLAAERIRSRSSIWNPLNIWTTTCIHESTLSDLYTQTLNRVT